jgi:isopentenyl diphosphate isomerase/L-lactate dehydrogenase-like FMN-dependent dehydrogenase
LNALKEKAAGASQIIQMLRRELEVAMALLGAVCIQDLVGQHRC